MVCKVYNRHFRARTFSEHIDDDEPAFTLRSGVRAGSAEHAIPRRQCQIDGEHCRATPGPRHRPTMRSSALATALARRNIHYGWVVVSVTFLTMLVTAGAMGSP